MTELGFGFHTFLEDSGSVHLYNCLIGILVFLAVTHGGCLTKFEATAVLYTYPTMVSLKLVTRGF